MTDKQAKLEVVGEPAKIDPTDVFNDLAALRKASRLTVQRKSVLVNVAVDRPANNVYFRCHPDLLLDDATVLRDNEGTSRTFYFVVPAMRAHPQIAPHLRPVTLALTSTWPSGNILIWPVPILGDRDFKVWKSARTAFELAREHWVQMAWNEFISDYQIETAEGIDHQPAWPTEAFEVLLKRAFDGKVIDNQDHPYVRRLRGILD